jgi:hypothetical protein
MVESQRKIGFWFYLLNYQKIFFHDHSEQYLLNTKTYHPAKQISTSFWIFQFTVHKPTQPFEATQSLWLEMDRWIKKNISFEITLTE